MQDDESAISAFENIATTFPENATLGEVFNSAYLGIANWKNNNKQISENASPLLKNKQTNKKQKTKNKTKQQQQSRTKCDFDRRLYRRWTSVRVVGLFGSY